MRNVFKHRYGVVLALLLTLFVTSGCITPRIGVNWAAVSTATDSPNIVLAYNFEVLQVDPRSGNLAELVNADGETRFDPQTGQARRWIVNGQTAENAQFFSAPLTLAAETLLLPEYTGRLVEVETATARIINPNKGVLAGRVLTTPTRDDERLYFALETGVEALNAQTLEQEWFVPTQNGVWATPTLHEGVVYFTSMDHYLYAIDAVTGDTLWKRDLGGAAASSPLVSTEGDSTVLYVGTFARKLVKFDLEGRVMNEYTTVDWVWSTPVLFDGTLYAADLAGYVYALNPADLSEIWKVQATSRGIRPSPLVTGDYVIVAARDGLVKWLNRQDGATVYERNAEAEVLSELLLIEPSDALNLPQPLVIVSTVAPNRLLIAYTLNEAGQQWVYPPQ